MKFYAFCSDYYDDGIVTSVVNNRAVLLVTGNPGALSNMRDIARAESARVQRPIYLLEFDFVDARPVEEITPRDNELKVLN